LTYTVQPRSLAALHEAARFTDADKREIVEELQNLLTLFNGLNSLCEELKQLGYTLKEQK